MRRIIKMTWRRRVKRRRRRSRGRRRRRYGRFFRSRIGYRM